jgi:hypothetical protein
MGRGKQRLGAAVSSAACRLRMRGAPRPVTPVPDEPSDQSVGAMVAVLDVLDSRNFFTAHRGAISDFATFAAGDSITVRSLGVTNEQCLKRECPCVARICLDRAERLNGVIVFGVRRSVVPFHLPAVPAVRCAIAADLCENPSRPWPE